MDSDASPDSESETNAGPPGVAPQSLPLDRSRIGRRGGLCLWVGLSTLMGQDRRPAELAGWGYVHAELARSIAREQRSWWIVVTDKTNTPRAILNLRRRPSD